MLRWVSYNYNPIFVNNYTILFLYKRMALCGHEDVDSMWCAFAITVIKILKLKNCRG